MFFNGERVARVDMPANTVEYYFSDHLNSTDIVTNATGGIVRESDYVPYGGEVVISGTDPNRYKFTGKERDPESGLDDFDARFYSSPFARFMTPDWEAKPTDVPYANFGNPQSLNLYSYVQNNPTTMGDPDGHCLEDACIAEGAAIVALYAYTTSPAGQQVIRNGLNALANTPSLIRNTFFSSDNSSDNSKTAPAPTEQGRDAQGRFLPKQPGQTQPGAAGEKEGLASEGATKNTKPLPGSKTIPDGTRPDGTKVEVKSGKTLNNTGQVKDMGQATVNATGKPLTVVTTNPNVQVSKPAANNPNLVIKPLKKPE